MKRRTVLKIIGVFVALEAISCAILHFTHTVPNASKFAQMPAYLTWDEASDTLALTPKTELTYKELLAELRRAGQPGLSAVLDVELTMNDVPQTETGLKIDEHGLRAGTDVKNPDMTVLVLADSTAFGVMQGHTYPDYLQKYLNINIPQLSIEVLNAGVPAHTTKDALDRLPNLKHIKPDVVAIYLGINDLYRVTPTVYGLPTFTLRLAGKFAPSLNKMADTGIFKTLAQLRMHFYTPPGVKNMEKLAKHFNAEGVKVVFIAPAMLADTPQETPEFSKDKIAQSLPSWTNNPDMLALANRSYLEGLLKIAPKLGVDIINATDWLAITSENQHAFYDNVHLTSTGADAFAQFLTSGLRITVENVYLDKQARAEAEATAKAEAQAKAETEAGAQ